MSDIDLSVRAHSPSDPTVVRRRGELRRAARLLKDRCGGFVRGRRSRARRTLVHQLAKTMGTSYRHARYLIDRMRERGLLRFDRRRRGFRISLQES